jgi:hypothetical protein
VKESKGSMRRFERKGPDWGEKRVRGLRVKNEVRKDMSVKESLSSWIERSDGSAHAVAW